MNDSSARTMPPEMAHKKEFLETILGSDQKEHRSDYCVEIRTVQKCRLDRRTKKYRQAQPGEYGTILSGYFNHRDSLAREIDDIRDVSIYIIPNPVDRSLLSRANNRLIEAAKGLATKDEDILRLRWLLLDIDSRRKNKDLPATDAEHGEALALRDVILAAHPEVFMSAMWGSSGNGGSIYLRLPDYPNDEPHVKLLADVLGYLDRRFSNDKAEVDAKTFNPSRLMPLPGTRKCKGEDLPERPRRMVTLDGHNRGEPVDLVAWWAALPEERREPPKVVAPVPALRGPVGLPIGADPVARARAYLEAMAPAVSGQGGHNQTFDAACALVGKFGLSKAEARPLLDEWNLRCQPPWSGPELDHKMEDAYKKVGGRGPDPDVLAWISPPQQAAQDGRYAAEAAALAAAFGGAAGGGPGGPHGGGVAPGLDRPECPRGQEADPHRLARLVLAGFFHPDGQRLRYWREDWWEWDGARYRALASAEVNARVVRVVAEEFQALYARDLAAHRQGAGNGGAGKPPELRPVTVAAAGNVTQALKSLCLLRKADVGRMPAWLGGRAPDGLDAMVPTVGAILCLRGDAPATIPSTPRFFNSWTLPYDFRPDDPRPKAWHDFLTTLWPDDPESIATLQEWFGLSLLPDTRFQKILALIGPKRAGKDTIARTLRAIIGEENVAGPTLSGLATNFGLAPLVDKPLAIVSDARLSGRTDTAAIIERLLTISGEGTLTVDRKHREAWTGKLPTRFVLISNELPRLIDSSGALASRLVILKLTRSFYGREDLDLFEKIRRELPGILLWAIEGWRRLRERGHFVQPPSGAELVTEMEDLSSPIGSFVRENLDIKPGLETPVKEAYARWCSYCNSVGHKEPGDQATFGRNLRTVVPHLKTTQKRRYPETVRVFEGLGLKTNADIAPETEDYPF